MDELHHLFIRNIADRTLVSRLSLVALTKTDSFIIP